MIADAVAPHRGAERFGARNQNADQVGHRRAGNEEAGRRVGKAEKLAHPANDLLFDLDRHMVAPPEIRI